MYYYLLCIALILMCLPAQATVAPVSASLALTAPTSPVPPTPPAPLPQIPAKFACNIVSEEESEPEKKKKDSLPHDNPPKKIH